MGHEIKPDDIINCVDIASVKAWGPEGFRHIAARVIDSFLEELEKLGYQVIKNENSKET